MKRSPAVRDFDIHRGVYFRVARLSVYLFCAYFASSLWQQNSIADTPDAAAVTAVEAALARLDATNLDDDWFFLMEVIEEGETRIIRSDPLRDKYERRQLLTVNGVVPDNARQQKFRESEVKRIDELDPNATGYRYLVEPGTLQLIEDSEGYAKLTFVPRLKAMEASPSKLRGVVQLNQNTEQIEEIEIYNTGKFSPVFSVTLDTYRLTLKFQQEQGENLLHRLESHAVGKVGFVKSFDAVVEVTFSDYTRADS